MPSKMPDRALRLRRRRPIDLVEQDQHVIGRVERRIAAPFSFARAWELPGVEIDRRLRIDRIEVQMMKAGGAEHRDRSSPQNSVATMRSTPAKSTPRGSPPVAAFARR